jgi:hypothetical protein
VGEEAVHLCTISADHPAMMQLRTDTVRFRTLGSFGARMMQKCTAPCSPSMPQFAGATARVKVNGGPRTPRPGGSTVPKL